MQVLTNTNLKSVDSRRATILNMHLLHVSVYLLLHDEIVVAHGERPTGMMQCSIEQFI